MKKVMLLAAMLAMVLAAAVPALAQTVTQIGDDNIACVQTAIQQEVNKTQIAISQYGDATNINIQAISQECNINVTEVEAILAEVGVTQGAGAAGAGAAGAGAAAAVQYQYAAAAVQYQYAAPAVQYQYAAPAELPPTGGSSLIALGVGVLLVAGGLLARRIVR